MTRGFSLIEILIATVLVVVVALVVFALMSASSSGYEATVSTSTIQELARRAVDDMARELRVADEATLAITAYNGSDRVVFRAPKSVQNGKVEWDEYVQYRWEPSSVDANSNGIADDGQVVRVQAASTLALCNGVPQGGLSMTRSGDTVSIRLQLMATDGRGRPLQTDMQTAVTLRNSSR